jgi:hypothetical protein
MNTIYYLKIGQSGSGLTNQLFTFITSILIHSSNNPRAIIIDNFQDDFQSATIRSPISSIFDMQQMNIFLKNNFNILIFDKNEVEFKIESITYGVNENIFDITEEIVIRYYKENTLCIPKNIIFNSIKGDPKSNVKKQLLIKYSINGEMFNETFPENPLNNIVFNLQKAQYINKFLWINALNRTNFDYILKNICFNSKFMKIIPDFKEDKINVVHLRIEGDAVNHWSKQNKMSPAFFQTYIEDKYIDLIKNHVLKTDANIILTYSENNRVIDYLKTNNYKYYISEKKTEVGREVNAISDLLISEKCNNIFIGGFNIEKLNGSTFSYCIIQKMKQHVKKILIDLDLIQNKEYILI